MDLESLREVARAALQNLEANRQRIDDLNVYPVPDGDTGTNLLHTAGRIVAAIEESSVMTASELADEVSDVAFRAGKGNSGVILSQIVRGLASSLGEDGELTPASLSRALRAGSDAAYRAVERVGATEGTILTVIREMSEEAALHADGDVSIAELVGLVLARGEDALARTPDMLEILKQAGVVDAGGAGLVELVRGISLSLKGERIPDAPPVEAALGYDAVHQALSRYRYCTGFVVEGGRVDEDRIVATLEALGDSLLVVGDQSALKVHVHTDDPGAALSAAIGMGALDEVEIADMYAQAAAREARLAGAAPLPPFPLATGVVAVAQGPVLRALFAHEFASVVDGGQTENPSVGDLVDAIAANEAASVIVLPNNSNVLLAAREAAELSAKDVRVVPSRSVQAGIAAIGSSLLTEPVDRVEAGMREILGSIATGDVAVASRDVDLDGVRIRAGDYLGRVDEKVVVADSDFDEVVTVVVDAVLSGEVGALRILVGQGAPPLARLLSAIEDRHPDVELDLHVGWQPHYPLLVVAE